MFVYNYAKIAAPLTNLTRGVKFKDDSGKKSSAWRKQLVPWTTEAQAALDELKRRLSSAPVLAYPDWNQPFIMYIDASKEAFAVALHQRLPTAQSAPESTSVTARSHDTSAEADENSLLQAWRQDVESDDFFKDIVEHLADHPEYSWNENQQL